MGNIVDRLSYVDFHRFVSSLGLAMIALAGALPWLYLQVPVEPTGMSPGLAADLSTTQSHVAARQDLIDLIFQLIPFVSSLLLVVGTTFLFRGLISWHHLQRLRDSDEVRKLTSDQVVARRVEGLASDIPHLQQEREANDLDEPPNAKAQRPKAGEPGDSDKPPEPDEISEGELTVRRHILRRQEIYSGVQKMLADHYGSEQVRFDMSVAGVAVDALVRTRGRWITFEIKNVGSTTGMRRAITKAFDQAVVVASRVQSALRSTKRGRATHVHVVLLVVPQLFVERATHFLELRSPELFEDPRITFRVLAERSVLDRDSEAFRTVLQDLPR